jgi:SdrD B-like domain/Protein of unknown function (DUF642)
MNIFISQTNIVAKTLAIFTIVSLFLGVLPASVFATTEGNPSTLGCSEGFSGVFPDCVPDPVPGCTDPLAPNYEPSATVDNGSCTEVVDVCSNIDGVQSVLPEGYSLSGVSTCDEVATPPNDEEETTGEDKIQNCIGENLLTNGSFEEPTIGSDWSILNAVTGWTSSLGEFEIWRNFNGSGAGSASDGAQNIELDGTAPTILSQSLVTVPGNEYQVTFDFSPRAGRNLADNEVEILFNGVSQGTVAVDGTNNTQNEWTTHNFVATTNSANTVVEFKDVSDATSFGTLIDNARVCLVRDNSIPATQTISGYKFNDENGDGEWSDGEQGLEGWVIELMDSEGEFIDTTTTDEDGYYEFVVENGSYSVGEQNQSGWEQTATLGSGADGNFCYYSFGEIIENDSAKTAIESARCDFGNQEIDEVPACIVSKNLLANGSFETPVVENERGWDIFESVVNGLAWTVSWLNPIEGAPEVASLELQRSPLFKTASDGAQYAELDSNYTHPGEETIDGDARVKIAQTIETVPDKEYTITFDFSAIPWGRSLKNNIVIVRVDGAVVYTASESLPKGATETDWSNHTVTFKATSAQTVISFEDGATTEPQMTNTFGTLIDNVSLTTCLPKDGDNGGDKDTYKLFGYVWDDEDEDDLRDEEPVLEGWTVRAVNAEDEEDVYTDVTDADGRYELNVPAGTWIISQLTEEGWVLLSVADGDGTYTVTVPEVETLTLLDMILPTAEAATLGEYGPYNFGNDFVGENRGGGSSNRGGTRIARDLPPGEVLGDSITTVPAGEVLGAATSELPVGAPNTGAGGTAPVSISLPNVVAIFTTTPKVQKTK